MARHRHFLSLDRRRPSSAPGPRADLLSAFMAPTTTSDDRPRSSVASSSQKHFENGSTAPAPTSSPRIAPETPSSSAARPLHPTSSSTTADDTLSPLPSPTTRQSSSSLRRDSANAEHRVRIQGSSVPAGGTGSGGRLWPRTSLTRPVSCPAVKVTAPPSTDTRSITAKSMGAVSTSASVSAESKVLTPEEEVLSLRVRSLYDSGCGMSSDVGSQYSGHASRRRVSSVIEVDEGGKKPLRDSLIEESEENGKEDEQRWSQYEEADGEVNGDKEKMDEKRRSSGSIMDDIWEDLEGVHVDRYGFVDSTYISTSAATPSNLKTQPRRVSTALMLQSGKSQHKRTAGLRRLRLSPSAPEMLQSPLPRTTQALKDKESERSKKWREMAVMRKKSERGTEKGKGGGLEWSFVTRDPKLISRTWKGIPDCWRGAAWHAFLTASAKKRGVGETDQELMETYRGLLERPSADDVQIDLDVPRTISTHIMFRRRYRTGQRLLFRILHSLSLYFPTIGYVQGMASLAATLLCYYDEETAFIMLVRLFQLRGLGKLYQAGFSGLMDALQELEGGWIKGGPVARKLSEVGIDATAYGTRWYLTLFNYSIPFQAQLRVWDVFMLLGDPEEPHSRRPGTARPRTSRSRAASVKSSFKGSSEATRSVADGGSDSHSPAVGTERASTEAGMEAGFEGSLDILHATSAALLDGMKGILVKSDFEGVMKVVTSFIPIKDEDTLLRVAKEEWKRRRRKRGLGELLHVHDH